MAKLLRVLVCMLLLFAVVGLTIGFASSAAEASWLTHFMASTSWWWLALMIDGGGELYEMW